MYHTSKENPDQNNGNVAMDQGKVIDRTFVCKNGEIGVYRSFPDS
jgi:hypothetical protein